MPGLNDILKQNPDLMRNVKQAAMNTMKNNMNDSGESSDPIMGMMMNNAQRQFNTSGKNMRGPSGVDDILNQLNNDNRPQGVASDDDENTVSSIGSNESLKKKTYTTKKTNQ